MTSSPDTHPSLSLRVSVDASSPVSVAVCRVIATLDRHAIQAKREERAARNRARELRHAISAVHAAANAAGIPIHISGEAGAQHGHRSDEHD